MKCLVFILAIGLLVPCFAHTMRPRNEVTVMCGRELIQKLARMCGQTSSTWKVLLHHQYDLFQTPDDNDYFKETDMKKVPKIYDDNRIQQLESHYGQKPFYSDYSQYEQIRHDFNEYTTETENDRVMQPALSKRFSHNKMTYRQISILNKCCTHGCNIRDFAILC